MPRTQKKTNQINHPYMAYEGTELWKALNKGIGDLVRNQDVIEQEHRTYIVGYLCKVLIKRKSKLFLVDKEPS
jgi:hypothetical protein